MLEENIGKQNKTYRIDQKIKALDSITFGTTELLAIYAAYAAVASFAGTPLHADLYSVMTKIRGFLTASAFSSL